MAGAGQGAFRLANAGEIGINPDQRLHEDARHFAEMSCDLGINLLQSTVILVSFVGVLWSLSSGFVFHVAGYSFSIPGYMVWAVILYAASASWLTWIVGRSLVNINANRYAREADFRASLMRVNEHLDAITPSRGEGMRDAASIWTSMRFWARSARSSMQPRG